MSRKIKHVIGWGMLGAIIAAFFITAAITNGIIYSLFLFGGIILLGAIAIIAALLIVS